VSGRIWLVVLMAAASDDPRKIMGVIGPFSDEDRARKEANRWSFRYRPQVTVMNGSFAPRLLFTEDIPDI